LVALSEHPPKIHRTSLVAWLVYACYPSFDLIPEHVTCARLSPNETALGQSPRQTKAKDTSFNLGPGTRGRM